MENLGILIKEQTPADFVVGSFTPIIEKGINPNGDWSDYLPVVEYQNNGGFDKMACVSYSLLNCLETLYLYKTKKERNFSDRFLATASGTTRAGNYLEKVFDTARNIGLVDENDYKDIATNWDDYYRPIDESIFEKAKQTLTEFNLYREWIPVYNKDLIYNSLKEAPLQVIVAYASGDGFLSPTGRYNHAVMVYNSKYGEYWEIYDHYTQTRKKYAWNYEFRVVLKPNLIIKQQNMFIPKDNVLYQYVQGIGGFGLGLNGKMILGDTAKILASWIVRNNGDIKGKTQPIITADWNACKMINLKGEPIN